MKQAPRTWYQELKNFLLQFGFRNSYADTSLFIFHADGYIMYLLVYVNDLILTGDHETKVNHFIAILAQRFSIKELGLLTYFLGVEVIPNQHGLLLSQRRYITYLLIQTKMQDAKAVLTPLPISPTLTLTSGSSLFDPTKYRKVVGSLQYLLITRPDIAFAINKLSQYMHCPTTDHWSFVKRLLRLTLLMMAYNSTKTQHSVYMHFLTLLSVYKHFRTQIGQGTRTLFAPPVLMLFILVKIQSHSVLKSNTQLLGLPQRQSIVPLPIQLLNLILFVIS